MMNNFDKTIGYELIKKELLQVCDMIKNRESYEKLGAKMQCGILLYGRPGLEKMLMVDRSSLVIAVFNGQNGGTKNTIKYAKRKCVRVENVLAIRE